MKRLPLFQIAATGLFWAWCFIWMSNAGDADWPIRDSGLFAAVRLPFWLGNCIALAVFVVMLDRHRGVANRPAIAVCGLLQAIGTLLVMALSAMPSPPAVALGIAAFVAGFATAGYLPGWRKSVANTPAGLMPLFVGASGSLGAAVFLADLLLPTTAAQAVFVALPLASGALAIADPDAQARVFDPVRPDAGFTGSPRVARQLKWVYIGVTFAILFVMGLDTLGYNSPGSPSWHMLVAGLVLSLVFLAVFCLSCGNADVSRFLVAPYMPFAIATCMVVPFAGSGASTLLQALITLDFACWCFMLAEGLGMALQSPRSHAIQDVALGVCPIAAYAIQSFLGVGEADGVLLMLTYAVVVVTALLIMVHTSLFTQRRVEGQVNMRATVRVLAESKGLSNREAEVLMYLAMGHGQPYIAEQLCLAPGTVKTHVLHIYQKLDVHGREELLEKIHAANEGLFSGAAWPGEE